MGRLCLVLFALAQACLLLFCAQPAKAQVFSGDQLYIAPDELLFIDEPLSLDAPLFSTVNRGQLILANELIHEFGAIQQGSEALTGGWRQELSPFEPAPNDHVTFEQGADWNDSKAGFIDGAVRKVGAEDFVFPTADIAMGTLFSGKIAIRDKISVSPVDALFRRTDPTRILGGTLDKDLSIVSEQEYWQIWSDMPLSVELIIERPSEALALLGTPTEDQDLGLLTVAGWNGSMWVDLNAELSGDPATLEPGDGLALRLDVPRAYFALTLAARRAVSSEPHPNPSESPLLLARLEAMPPLVRIGDEVTWHLELRNPSPVILIGEPGLVLPFGFSFDREDEQAANGVQLGPPEGETRSAFVHPDSQHRQGVLVSWPAVTLGPGEAVTLSLSTILNIASLDAQFEAAGFALGTFDGQTFHSNLSLAEVQRYGEPAFDCATIIGRVFEDHNGDGYPDPGEPGVPNTRLGTEQGALVTTDAFGRYHMPCYEVGNDIGKNAIIKLDERSLPSGRLISSENPRVVRLTPGKMTKLSFAVSTVSAVNLAFSACSFETLTIDIMEGTNARFRDLPLEWQQGVASVVQVLKDRPSRIHITFNFAAIEPQAINKQRIEFTENLFRRAWQLLGDGSRLDVRSKIVWHSLDTETANSPFEVLLCP